MRTECVPCAGIIRIRFKGYNLSLCFTISTPICARRNYTKKPTRFTVGGRSSFEVEVHGVPPVWTALPDLPWPSLSDSSLADLRSLTVAESSSASFSAGWSVARGTVGVDGMAFCSDRALCGAGDSGRLGESGLRGGATSGSVTLRTGAQALAADDYKMLAIYGGLGDGTGLQSNHMSCPAVAPGLACEN